jgi:hypothetical protein
MKRGDNVYVCYDGKYSRRVVGTVLATKQTGKVLIEFPEYAGKSVLQHWFPRRSRQHRYGGRPFYYGGYVPVYDSLMGDMFDTPGDWYTVFP